MRPLFAPWRGSFDHLSDLARIVRQGVRRAAASRVRRTPRQIGDSEARPPAVPPAARSPPASSALLRPGQASSRSRPTHRPGAPGSRRPPRCSPPPRSPSPGPGIASAISSGTPAASASLTISPPALQSNDVRGHHQLDHVVHKAVDVRRQMPFGFAQPLVAAPRRRPPPARAPAEEPEWLHARARPVRAWLRACCRRRAPRCGDPAPQPSSVAQRHPVDRTGEERVHRQPSDLDPRSGGKPLSSALRARCRVGTRQQIDLVVEPEAVDGGQVSHDDQHGKIRPLSAKTPPAALDRAGRC